MEEDSMTYVLAQPDENEPHEREVQIALLFLAQKFVRQREHLIGSAKTLSRVANVQLPDGELVTVCIGSGAFTSLLPQVHEAAVNAAVEKDAASAESLQGVSVHQRSLH